MNKNWSDFLSSRPQQALKPDAACALNDLSHFGLIRVSGEDAMTLLQGQLTNDMREVTALHSNLAGWCNVKGRMLGIFRVFLHDEDYLLQLPAHQTEAILKRLKMFVLMSKATVEDFSDQLARFGVTGSCATKTLQAFFGALPEQANGVIAHQDCTLIRLPGDTDRFQVVGPAAELEKLWQNLEDQGVRMGEDFWALQDIRAGQPRLYADTEEAFVPQMANMQLIDGVSFTKGCYTGQEVVARMQYLGKLKRRMYLAHVNSDTPPKPGDELYAASSSSGQGTGRILDAQPAAEGYDLLAVIEIASAENDNVRLGADGPELKIQQLPYPFKAAD